MPQPAKAVPFYPELIRGDGPRGPWTVEENKQRNGCVILNDRYASVPKPITRENRQVHLHELGHVKWTPRNWLLQNQNPEWEAMLHEILVDEMLARHVEPVHHSLDQFDWSVRTQWITTPRAAAIAWLQTWHPLTMQRERNEINPNLEAYADHCLGLLEYWQRRILYTAALEVRSDPTWSTAATQAKILADTFEPAAPPPPPLTEEAQEAEQEALEEEQEREDRVNAHNKKEDSDKVTYPSNAPRMVIHEHVLTNRGGKRIASPGLYQDHGVVPTAWHRWPYGQTVFKATRRGGTILLDMSGSMSPDWIAIQQLFSRLPALTVAGYQGFQDPRQRGIAGRLCIYGQNGRWPKSQITFEEGHRGNNAVDLEALEWLAQQRPPLVWVSDGGVNTGAYSFSELTARCNAVLKRRKIVRLAHPSLLDTYFDGGMVEAHRETGHSPYQTRRSR